MMLSVFFLFSVVLTLLAEIALCCILPTRLSPFQKKSNNNNFQSKRALPCTASLVCIILLRRRRRRQKTLTYRRRRRRMCTLFRERVCKMLFGKKTVNRTLPPPQGSRTHASSHFHPSPPSCNVFFKRVLFSAREHSSSHSHFSFWALSARVFWRKSVCLLWFYRLKFGQNWIKLQFSKI